MQCSFSDENIAPIGRMNVAAQIREAAREGHSAIRDWSVQEGKEKILIRQKPSRDYTEHRSVKRRVMR